MDTVARPDEAPSLLKIIVELEYNIHLYFSDLDSIH